MNNNKMHLVIFLSIIFALPAVFAASQRLLIINLYYDHGNITMLNSTVKYGFLPDRRYQPENGYMLEEIALNSSKVYEFKFKSPNEFFVDFSDENSTLSGGKLVLEETKFAMVLPYHDNLKEIKIYSPSGKVAGRLNFEKKKEAKQNASTIWVGFGGILVIVLLIFMFLNKNKKKRKK
jgi:hypothetical protein